jgi:hypothetical protein
MKKTRKNYRAPRRLAFATMVVIILIVSMSGCLETDDITREEKITVTEKPITPKETPRTDEAKTPEKTPIPEETPEETPIKEPLETPKETTEEGGLETLDKTAKIDIEHLDSLLLNPDEDYIQELTSIIKSNSHPYVRERGIFTLTDITIRKKETEKIVDFLKEIAMDEKEDNVRTAAYANIYLIRNINPLEKRGSLDMSVTGDIKKGANITLNAKISSSVTLDEEAIIGVRQLPDNIELLSNGAYRIKLIANNPQEIEFDLHLKETGNYMFPVNLKLSFDRIDYELVTKQAHIEVGERTGEFFSD